MPTVLWLSTNLGTILQSSTPCDQNSDLWTFHKLVNSAADSLNFYCIPGWFKIIPQNQDNKKYHTLRNLGFGRDSCWHMFFSVSTCLSAGQCGGCPFSGCGGSRSSHPGKDFNERSPQKLDIHWNSPSRGNKIPSNFFFWKKYVKNTLNNDKDLIQLQAFCQLYIMFFCDLSNLIIGNFLLLISVNPWPFR